MYIKHHCLKLETPQQPTTIITVIILIITRRFSATYNSINSHFLSNIECPSHHLLSPSADFQVSLSLSPTPPSPLWTCNQKNSATELWYLLCSHFLFSTLTPFKQRTHPPHTQEISLLFSLSYLSNALLSLLILLIAPQTTPPKKPSYAASLTIGACLLSHCISFFSSSFLLSLNSPSLKFSLIPTILL